MADDTALLIDKSRSPDGKYELWIIPGNDDGGADGIAEIRRVTDGNIVGTFDWAGFGVRPDEHAFEVLWRDDSRFFSITWEEARGWMTGAIFGQTRAGKWTEIKVPADQYDAAIKRMAGIKDFSGEGCDSPQRWTSEGHLELLFTDRNLYYRGEGDLEKEFVIELQPFDRNGWPIATAKIVSIHQKTEAEVEHDMQSR